MRTFFLICLGALLGVLLLPYLVIRQPDMPPGTSLHSPAFAYGEAELLIDRTRSHPEGARTELDHRIFDAILSDIAAAESFIIADFFLWNPWTGGLAPEAELRPLSTELADALIAKRIQNPDMPILVITDPINRTYGHEAPEYFARMAEAGIPVVFTDVARLPDSNRVYAPQAKFWKLFFEFDERETAKGRFPNPFNPGGRKMSLSQLERLLYFKANHRKVLVTGSEDSARLIIGSLNPADGSALHSNLAVRVDGPVAGFAARSEMELARWSAEAEGGVMGGSERLRTTLAELERRLPAADPDVPSAGDATVAYLSEGAIRKALVDAFDSAVSGSRIDIGVFYFSDRAVVEALKAAIERGASVRILLDANRDAFGREKNGVPNRPLAAEFMSLADTHEVEVRWAATHGEQFHSKVLRISGPEQDLLLLGSANWTRRNLADLNLESNLLFENAREAGGDFDRYFESVWTNADGFVESLPYADWAETGWSLRWKTWLYRFQEWSGLSTF